MKNPRHILITGASSGLGAALAMAYAGDDVHLSLQGRNEERLDKIADQARQKGSTVSCGILDVWDADNLASWINDEHENQPIDLGIVNAGISAGTGSGLEKKEQREAIFATNLQGAFATIDPLLENMAKSGQGQIALISSLAGFRGLPGAASYAASKAALRVYGESLRGSWQDKNVEINVICPGFIKTPMTDVNPFPMPFLMSADKAATIIKKGLSKNKARIAFPWGLSIIMRLLLCLPQDWIAKLLKPVPQKPPFVDSAS